MGLNLTLLLYTSTVVTGITTLIYFLFIRKSATASNINVTLNHNKITKKADNHWLVKNSLLLFPVLTAILLFRTFYLQPFIIPSESMLPTLEKGDIIVVKKHQYSLRTPISRHSILDLTKPKRGEIIVFQHPVKNHINYIKRVVGLPGDLIQYKNKTLYINHQAIQKIPIRNYHGLSQFQSNLGDISYHYLLNDSVHIDDTEGEWTIPENSYFALGDNRDNSQDSRLFGPIHENLILGRADTIIVQWPSIFSLPNIERSGIQTHELSSLP